VPPAPQPRLGEILSPEELREHVESYDRSLRNTRGMLTQISKHLLTAEQSQTAARIQTFLRQAEETRRPDLVAAANLARRAELLAKDLLSQLP
jgi:chromosomal replication initiation ATPase DnaA